MEKIIETFVNGLSYGMVLFLIASGFSLIFGVMGILNLAHGSLYMLGAYFGYTVAQATHSYLWGLLAAIVGIGLLGLLLQQAFLARLYKRIPEQVLLTLGLVYFFSNLALWIWGPFAKVGSAPGFTAGSVDIGEMTFSLYRLTLILVGIAIAVILYLFQEKSHYGAIIRAGMNDKEMIMALGINYQWVSCLVFFFGSVLVGGAGFLGSPILGMHPWMSFDVLLVALAVIVIGGVGYVQGALLGAVSIGLIDSFGKVYFADFALFTIYLAMIVTLMIRPAGLMGKTR
jgi:branched-chain amino acid transport system permease protein